MKKLIVILIISTGLILSCLGYVGHILFEYHESNVEYEEIQKTYVEDFDEDASVFHESPIPYRDIDMEGLLSQNPDFVCWLSYADGNVDYPVLKEQETDINGYLHRTFEGQANGAGCLFIPYDASDGFTDNNTFVYGHNMKNGSMFGSLKKIFRDPKANFTDPYFYVWTKDGEAVMYRVISMYVTDKDSSFFGVPKGNSAYDEYLSDILGAGSMNGFIPFTDSEELAMDNRNPIVTFSVCYGQAGTRNRLLVHGIEIYKETYERRAP